MRERERGITRFYICGAFCTILGLVANSNYETAQIREYLTATEKDLWQRVANARAGLDTWRVDAIDLARRNYDTAQEKTLELVAQTRQMWTENTDKFVETVKAAWEKQRSG